MMRALLSVIVCALSTCHAVSECEADQASALQVRSSTKTSLSRRAGLLHGDARLEEAFFFKPPIEESDHDEDPGHDRHDGDLDLSTFFKGPRPKWSQLTDPFDMIAVKNVTGVPCSDASAIRSMEGCKKAAALFDEVTSGPVRFMSISDSTRPLGCHHWAERRTLVWNRAKTQRAFEKEGRFSVCKARLTEVELQLECSEDKGLVTEGSCLQAGKLLSEQLAEKLYFDTIKNSQRPAGCYYFEAQASVIWNDVPTGNASESRKPLCIKSFEPKDNELYRGSTEAQVETLRYSEEERLGREQDEVREQVDLAWLEKGSWYCSYVSSIRTERGCKEAFLHRKETGKGKSTGPGMYSLGRTFDFEEINRGNRRVGCYETAPHYKHHVVVWNNAVRQTAASGQGGWAICKARLVEVEVQPQCHDSRRIASEPACREAARLLGTQLNRSLFWNSGAMVSNKRRPRGCYFWEEKDKVVWNDTPDGMSYLGRQPICIKATSAS